MQFCAEKDFLLLTEIIRIFSENSIFLRLSAINNFNSNIHLEHLIIAHFIIFIGFPEYRIPPFDPHHSPYVSTFLDSHGVAMATTRKFPLPLKLFLLTHYSLGGTKTRSNILQRRRVSLNTARCLRIWMDQF